MPLMNTVLEQIQRMDNDQLNTVTEAVKQQRTYNARQITRALRVGDRVSFNNRNAKMIGTVIKVNRKTVIVESVATSQLWKVSASLLTLEDA
jgi:predicted RNA-binding protein with PUA-like domain